MERKEKNQKIKRNLFLLISVILMIIYLTWRIFCTLPFEAGILQVIFGILLIIAEAVTCFTTFELYYRKFKSDGMVLDFPEVSHDLYPDVDVFIATHNEPLDILYKTANACTFMDYPDKSKVHIYFCDDGNRESVAQLAAQLNIGYLGLAENKHAKSGNLNNALEKTNSPLIATFDADMIPQHTFLMKTVPYFFLPEYISDDGIWRKRKDEEIDEDYKIGLIQTPQSFYNPDLFQYNLYSENNIPNEQDFFSREVNVMRNSSNAIAYTGSNTVISRQAMLDIGGFPYYTITEDFETSIRIQKENYITYATTEIQAAGLTTTTFKSMIKQRKRWAQGIIQSLQNTNAIFTRKLSIAGNLTYLSSYLYWWSFFNRIIFILAPIMFALFDFQVVNCSFEELLIFWLPSYTFYSFSFRYLSSDIRSNRWSQTIDTIFAPYLIVPIVLESLGIHEREFKITNKTKENKSDLIYATPHIILIILSIAALIRFTYGKYGWALIYSSIIIFWLMYNLVSLSYALFFMAGRRVYRKSERIKATEKIEISYMDKTYHAKTIDLSDEGMRFFSETALYIPKDETTKIRIYSQRYESMLNAKIVYVNKVENGWDYAVSVEAVDEANKQQYYQFIYDRLHSLPMTIDKWSTISDDIVRNVARRLKKSKPFNRKHARHEIDKMITFDDGSSGYVHDYNYQYLSISNLKLKHFNKEFKYTVNEDICLHLNKTDKLSGKFKATLFEVMNLEELFQQGVDLNDIYKVLVGDE